MSFITDEQGSKIAEWLGYAENYSSRDIVLHHRTIDDFANIGYVANRDSKKHLSINQKFGNIIIFDKVNTSDFHSFVRIVDDVNDEKLTTNKVSMGGNVFDEAVTSKLKGNGIRVMGVNQGNHLITLTFHKLPTDKEYLEIFNSREMTPGGVEDQIIQDWKNRYGLLTKEQVDAKLSELLGNNDKIVDELGFRARMWQKMSKV
jgi:hypothetical protein